MIPQGLPFSAEEKKIQEGGSSHSVRVGNPGVQESGIQSSSVNFMKEVVAYVIGCSVLRKSGPVK